MDMKRLFESKKKVNAIGAPNTKLIFTKAPFIQYEQILLDKNFRQYIETIMISKKILRMGIQKALIQKRYEIFVGSDCLAIEFYGLNRQFDWLELSLVYHKSDKHLTIYDSYNVDHAAKMIKSVSLQNFTERYSLTNGKKYDINNETQNHLLFKQVVVWSCNGCTVAPLTDYINNPIYQEVPTQSEYFTSSDERVQIDLRATYGYTKELQKLEKNDSKLNLKIELKNAAAKNIG